MFKNFRLFILASLFLTVSNISADEIPHPLKPLNLSYDVLHYDADVFLTAGLSTEAHGVNNILIYRSSKSDDDKFYFHLRDLNVDSVFYNDLKTEISTYGNYDDADYCHYFQIPDKSDSAVVSVFYSGKMGKEPGYKWGGVHNEDQMLYSLGVGFTCPWVSTTSHWLPCLDHPNDKVSYDIKYHVPTAYSVASNGLLTVHYLDNGTDIYQWASKDSIATYMMNFAMSQYVKGEIKGWKKPIEYYAKEVMIGRADFAFAKLPLVLEAFENYYGDYPFEKVGYVITTKGAMEHQTMISLPTSIISQANINKDSLNSTIAHELSHQWFGGMVTPEDFRDAWLNESFATFSEALFKEYIFGKENYSQILRQKRSDYLNNIAPAEGVFSLYDFVRESPSSNYPQTIYQKGALVVATLREFVGDEVFFQAIKNYFAHNAYSNVNTEKLKDEFKALTSKDIDAFFAQWVFGKGWPEFDIKVYAARNEQGVYDQSNSYISFKQVQAKSFGGYTFVPVPVTYFDESGNKIDTVYYISDVNQKFELPQMPGLDSIAIDNGTIVPLMKIKTIELDGITSVEELPISELGVYPNPACDYINIKVMNLTGRAEVSLNDLQGRAILTKETTLNGNSEIEFDLNHIPSGIYLLEVKNASETMFKTIQIIR